MLQLDLLGPPIQAPLLIVCSHGNQCVTMCFHSSQATKERTNPPNMTFVASWKKTTLCRRRKVKEKENNSMIILRGYVAMYPVQFHDHLHPDHSQPPRLLLPVAHELSLHTSPRIPPLFPHVLPQIPQISQIPQPVAGYNCKDLLVVTRNIPVQALQHE